MYINNLDTKLKTISVSIPLTKGTHKTRIKKRSIFNEYGFPVATKQEPFNLNCYVEWQIGYDIITNDTEKLQLTTLQTLRFIGSNTKEKALYELSEYIYYFYKWGCINYQTLYNIKTFLLSIKEHEFIDVNKDLSIHRTHPIEKNILNINFISSQVVYPILVYKFGNYDIITEIIIKEKQYAIGVQPMLYFCFPITELQSNIPLINRTAQTKEFANFIINENNITIFIEMLKIFGILSKNHNEDIIKILDLILS